MSTAFHDVSLPAQGRAFGTAKLHGFLEGRPDDRPPLVLLHGLTFDHRMWLPARAALGARDPERQVLVLDLPGHGGSAALQPRSDPEDVAAAVATAVQDAGLDRPVIVGHSMAAIIATVYAVTYPSRGVVNVDQPLDTSFIGLLQANREVTAGPGFAQLWPAILASMHIEILPESAQQLLSTELPGRRCCWPTGAKPSSGRWPTSRQGPPRSSASSGACSCRTRSSPATNGTKRTLSGCARHCRRRR